MKDEQALEEKLMAVLDRMYQHVVDLETGQAPVKHNHNSNEDGEMSDQEFIPHAKIIPFPGHKIHSPSEEPSEASEEEPSQKRQRSYRTYFIVASFSVIFLAFALAILLPNGMLGRRSSEKGEPYQATFPIHLKPSLPVQREQSVLQIFEEKEPQASAKPQQIVESKPTPQQIVEPKPTPQQIVEPKSPPQQTAESKPTPQQIVESKSLPAKRKHYAVQIGAFSDWSNASERMDGLRMKNLQPYWIEMHSRKSKTIYVIFSGSFTDRNEAVKFMKGKGIRKTYPDSFVRRISF